MAYAIQNGKVMKLDSSCKWNPFNKVFQSHQDGTIIHALTNIAREARGLPVPWTPEIGEKEVKEPPIE